MKDMMGPSSSQINLTWHKSGFCPEGTVPVRRTSHYTNNFSNFSIPYARLIKMNDAGHGRPLVQTNGAGQSEGVVDYSTNGPYQGASATLTFWDPHVESHTNEFSNSFILVGGVKPNKKTNQSLPFINLDYQIALGWAVFPAHYNDSRPRLHLYITLDGGDKVFCMNSGCGFVQTSSKIFPGASIDGLSHAGGVISHLSMLIHRELSDVKWWVSVDHEDLGYYPKEAVDNWMYGSLTMRGAMILNTMPGGHHTSTQMGSGYYPAHGDKYSAAIYDYYSLTNTGQLAVDPGTTVMTKPKCYNYIGLEPAQYNKSFLYGGPGGATCDP